MPKQAPDFRKQKTKLGKGKQAATNSTNTSFKARSVALPGQSILKDVDENEPHTKRNLTLKDLLVHLKHYSPNMRRDGVLGLRELITSYPSTISPNLTSIFDGITKLIVDEDAAVRRALHSLASDLFPRIPKPSWTPYSSILLLFTASGLSHIFPEVRLDSIKFLDILIDFIPQFVINGWAVASSSTNPTSIGGRQIIECYLALLSAKGDDKGPAAGSTVTTTANAMFTLSVKSRLVVLKSLSKFLKTALSSNDASDKLPLWPFASAFASQPAFDVFVKRIRRSAYCDTGKETVQWHSSHDAWKGCMSGYKSEIMEAGGSLTSDELNNAIGLLDSTQSASNFTPAEADVLSLTKSLFSVIVSVFLESAPSVFTMSNTPPDSIHLESITAVVEICRETYGYLLRNCSERHIIEKELSIILTHMSKYFPFGGDFLQKQAMEVDQYMLQLNVLYCELVSSLLLSQSSREGVSSGASKREQKLDKNIQVQMNNVCEWLSSMLSGNMTTAAQPMGLTVTADTYRCLVSSFWALLNLPNSVDASKLILEALLTHCTQAGIKSETKLLSVEFIARVYLTQYEMDYKGQFKLINNSEQDKMLTGWFNNLPRLLWETNNHNIGLTEVILDVIQAVMIMDTSNESKSSIAPGIKLFYEAHHATKGSIPGPWTRISDHYIHDRGIELAYTTGLSSIPSQDAYWTSLQA
ncbi:hypothetical protein E3P89_01275 [Wallemia ichthyophaga]|uniref:Pre-rRNA-processing protein n=1 Tax=Wallemia ichthyophaga TaxID=245174 RepID=A0A4T0HHD2_WALIC|nr:hypothetical protein E3P98_01537 [Wallemia ichthyophaga]TIB03404.1 hypothetical protein E3P95_00635 [Wallemia ichthyophaga]TIB04169.1 hypothetical protein E3P94_00638 [Wallemia ichthyophaga]TIB13235.1 hypothetical protein E3P90_01675 [Wallemia ichthyophaga]TIB14981.1 hypothetical protein E3P93_01425 [Wallemia ichthyophaga]